MTRRLIPAIGAVLALLLTACISGPGGHERWLRSRDVVASVTSTQLPTRSLGDRPSWHVMATLTPDATVADMAEFSAEWPARAKDSLLTLRRPASGDRPELSFTAWPNAGWTKTRWEIFALLQSTWPKAAVAIGEDQRATVTSGGCDPWDELDRIDVADLLARQHAVPLRMDCQGPIGATVSLSRRSVPAAAGLDDLRDRTRAVLSQLPEGTPWHVMADDPGRPLVVEVATQGIPAEPAISVMARERAHVTIKPTEPAGRVEVTVTGEADLRDVTRSAAELPWLDRIQVDSGQRSMELRGDLGRINEVVPLAQRHPELSWWLAETGERRRNWVRAPGAEFGERARQHQALVGSGIEWNSIILHHNQGRTLSVEVAEPGDWRPVVDAVRAVGWAGDMSVEIGSGYPGVVFTSTATGPARDAEVANSLRPPNREQHPELMAIIEAWDATAS